MAAKNGHLEICRLILANVNDKNPVNHDGETPSQLAAYHGHLPVMELIKSALSKKGLIKKVQNVPSIMTTHGLGSGPTTATTLGGGRNATQSSTTICPLCNENFGSDNDRLIEHAATCNGTF